MNELHTFLATVWFVLLGIIIALYVLLEGCDLGVSILSLLAYKPALRHQLREYSGRTGQANELWLVLAGGVLFGAFPTAYTLILHTLYIPLILLLGGLLMRRAGFASGSLLAAVAQGLILGELMGSMSGGLTPFTLVVSLGVVSGYALLGASSLLNHPHGSIKTLAKRWAMAFAVGALATLVTVLLWIPAIHPYLSTRWQHPATVVLLGGLLLAVLLVSIALLRSLREHGRYSPLKWSLTLFLLTFTGLAASLYPDIIPGHLGLEQAAASSKTLIFMSFGVGLLLPLLLAYNGFQYLLFNKSSEQKN